MINNINGNDKVNEIRGFIRKYGILIGLIAFIIVLNLIFVRLREIIYYSDDLESEIVEDSKKVVSESRETGYLAFVQEIDLPAGQYELTVKGQNDSDANTLLVWSNTQGGWYRGDAYVPGMAYDIVTDEADNYNIYVNYNGEGTCAVDKIIVKRVLTHADKVIICAINALLLAMALVIFVCRKKDKNYRWLKLIYTFTLFAIYTFFETILINEIAMNNCGTNYIHMSHVFMLDDVHIKLWALNAVILLAIHLVVYGLVRRPGISIIISSIVLWVFAEVVHNFYLLRGEMFTLMQLQATGEGAEVIGSYDITINWPLAGILITYCLVAACALGFENWGYKFYWGLGPVVIGVGMVACIYANILDILTPMGCDTVYVTKRYCDDVGIAVGMVRTAPRGYEAPDGYSKEKIDEILKDTVAEKDAKSTPNIIYIQCESLYDLSLESDAYWSENPLQRLYDAAEDADIQVGYCLTPAAGGGTCFPEYEALTGYTSANTNEYPYLRMIKPGTLSIVSILEGKGYGTTAIHTNIGGFFNRRVAYSNMGFDNLIFEEEYRDTGVLNDDDYVNCWAKDEAAYKLLIQDFEKRDKSKPYFAHVVTAQNHGAYNAPYYDGIDVDGDMNLNENFQLQAYLNESKLSVDSFMELIDYFRNVDEDTIIVFWGDHCPGFNLFGMNIENEVKLHFTPMVVWNNFGMADNLKDITATYQISPYVLNSLGIRSDVYMDYQYDNYMRGVYAGMEIENIDTYVGMDQWDGKKQEVWNNLWYLQYDRMFGKKYSVR